MENEGYDPEGLEAYADDMKEALISLALDMAMRGGDLVECMLRDAGLNTDQVDTVFSFALAAARRGFNLGCMLADAINQIDHTAGTVLRRCRELEEAMREAREAEALEITTRDSKREVKRVEAAIRPLADMVEEALEQGDEGLAKTAALAFCLRLGVTPYDLVVAWQVYRETEGRPEEPWEVVK